MIKTVKAKIIENHKILPEFFAMTLECPEIANSAKPGQFVMVKVSQSLDPLLKRPISINTINKEKGQITLIYQVVGRGTKILSELIPTEIEIMGPLGQGFTWTTETKTVALVGGGCGIAPLLALAQELLKENVEVHVLLGAQSQDKLINVAEFKELGCKVQVATDDGSLGQKGFVTTLLEDLLGKTKVDQVYCCGPLAMTKNVIKITKENLIPCQVSLEEKMACGVGACLGCVCKVRGEDGTITNKRVCHDGPVFSSSEVTIDE